VNIEQRLKTIVDDQLGIFEFLFSFIIIQFFQQTRFAGGYPRLIAPRVAMKPTTNVKLTHAPGFSKVIDSSSGKTPQGFFGLREKVSFPVSYLNLSDKHFHSRKR